MMVSVMLRRLRWAVGSYSIALSRGIVENQAANALYAAAHSIVLARQALVEDAVRSVNHTVSLDICVSAQHRFVSQAWSGPGVGIRPTRRPLRLSRHVPANG